MQSLWNFLLVLFCLILAAKFHTVDIDKTKLEYDKTSLQADKKQLHKRVQIAESKAEECVQANDACQQQLEKFETLKKTSLLNDDKIDDLEDQLRRQKLKKIHFRSLLNTTQQVYLADQLRRLKLKKKHDLTDRLRRLKLKKKYFQSLLNTTQQVKDEGQPVECVCEEVQPVQCAVEKNLDYAQTYICVVGASIFCLVCVCMHVLWNSYKTQTAESDYLTEEEILQFGNSLPVSSISKDGDGRLVVDQGVINSNARVLRELLKILRKDFTGKKLLCRPKKQKEETRWAALTASIWNIWAALTASIWNIWAALTASIWNKVQFDDIESNMISTATFYPRSHDTAENDINPSNKHGRFLHEYRAIPE